MLKRARGLAGGDFASAERSLVAKILMAPLVAVAWLTATRIVLSTLGVEGYAIYSVITGLAMLLPFADLGTGAALIDAMSRRTNDDGDDEISDVLLTCWRTLLAMMLVLAGVAALVAVTSVGTSALGAPTRAEYSFGIAIALLAFALGMPLSVAMRFLIGAGVTYSFVLFQGLAPCLSLVLVLAASHVTSAPWVYFAAPFVGTLASNALALTYAQRRFKLPLLAVARRVALLGQRGARVRHLAGPMLVISVIVPIAYQSDRIVLSHVASLVEVAEYGIAFQIFSPLIGLISTAGISLWPIFAARRAAGAGIIESRLFYRATLRFALLGLALGLVMIALGPIFGSYASDGKIKVGFATWLAFALLLLVQSASYPLSMLLTDSSGLRFQATVHVPALVLNIGLSVLLAQHLGASGPVVASVVATASLVVAPQWFRRSRYIGKTALQSTDSMAALKPGRHRRRSFS